MKNINVNIGTGGKVQAFNDNPPQEANWKRKEREMTERAARYYPNVKESALERELFNQVSGQNKQATIIGSKLVADFALLQSKLKRESDLNQTLFNQVANRG